MIDGSTKKYAVNGGWSALLLRLLCWPGSLALRPGFLKLGVRVGSLIATKWATIVAGALQTAKELLILGVADRKKDRGGEWEVGRGCDVM